jgi:hypothetical protein
MPLQSSGAISLNQIHIEAGGTSGTTASINDADIRGLIGKLNGAQQSFSEWYGASAGTVVTVTQGIKYQTMATLYGYSSSDSFGSVSPTGVDGDSLNNLSILNVYRVSSSGGLFFTIDVSYSSANAIAADEFSEFTMVCDGVTITVTTSEAQTSTLGGGYIRRWTWSSSYGLNSTEISKITTEWDGSGDIDVTFKP